MHLDKTHVKKEKRGIGSRNHGLRWFRDQEGIRPAGTGPNSSVSCFCQCISRFRIESRPPWRKHRRRSAVTLETLHVGVQTICFRGGTRSAPVNSPEYLARTLSISARWFTSTHSSSPEFHCAEACRNNVGERTAYTHQCFLRRRYH